MAILWFVLAGLASIFAYRAIWAIRKDMRLRKLIAGLPTSRISDAHEGLVQLEGRVEAMQRIKSPFTHTPCVYLNVVVQQESMRQAFLRDAFHNRLYNVSYKTIIDETDAPPFILNDGTGKAFIAPQDAVTLLESPTYLLSHAGSRASSRMEAYLQRHNKSSKGWFRYKVMRYAENFIKEGEEVYVLGTARPSEPSQGARVAVSKGSDGIFVISTKKESIMSNLVRTDKKDMIGAIMVAFFAVIFLLAGLVAIFT